MNKPGNLASAMAQGIREGIQAGYKNIVESNNRLPPIEKTLYDVFRHNYDPRLVMEASDTAIGKRLDELAFQICRLKRLDRETDKDFRERIGQVIRRFLTAYSS